MKVYVAAKYHRRFELRAFAAALRAHGIEVTARWLDNGEEEADGPAAAAQMDVDDVLRADALVFIGEARGSKNTGGGRWFELGLAYAHGKRCVVVLGPDAPSDVIGSAAPGHETVFTSLSHFELVDTLDDAMRALL